MCAFDLASFSRHIQHITIHFSSEQFFFFFFNLITKSAIYNKIIHLIESGFLVLQNPRTMEAYCNIFTHGSKFL